MNHDNRFGKDANGKPTFGHSVPIPSHVAAVRPACRRAGASRPADSGPTCFHPGKNADGKDGFHSVPNRASSIQYPVSSLQHPSSLQPFRSSADFQSAVSQNSILLSIRTSRAVRKVGAAADCKSAIQQIANLRYRRRAFTLIELLVVIAIMAILAALIIPGAAMAKAARIKARAKTELNGIAAMIQSYKTSKNYYPPSGPYSTVFNPLYYELVGSQITNAADPNVTFTTLNSYSAIKATDINNTFGIKGFANVSTGGDEGAIGQNFTKGTLRPGQFSIFVTNGVEYVLMVSSLEGPEMLPDKNNVKFNPISYNSANPTNNPKSYDLWLDITVRGKTNRIYSSFTTL